MIFDLYCMTNILKFSITETSKDVVQLEKTPNAINLSQWSNKNATSAVSEAPLL